MSPEQIRERWLKRLLPALVILTVYFAFVSHFVVESARKADEERKAFLQRGVSQDALPGLRARQEAANAELAALKKRTSEQNEVLKQQLDFAFEANYLNRMVNRVSQVLAEHHLRLLHDGRAAPEQLKAMPRTLLEMTARLQPQPSSADGGEGRAARVQTETSKPAGWSFHFRGAYPDVWRALVDLTRGHPSVIPVALTMQSPPEPVADMEWSLVVWVQSEQLLGVPLKP